VSDPISTEGSPAIQLAGVVKAFGHVTALDGVDLTVGSGTLAALLGPNGAGKTTLVRIIATLSKPDAGLVRVLGYDVAAQPAQVRARIGLTGQYAGLDEALRGQDNLVLIGRLAGLRRRQARQRAAELAGTFGLTDAMDRAVRTYSGGMRRRLDLAASLMTRPALLVLDEPTTGLDPASRQQLWAVLARLRAEGTTMLLTTQYLEEADRFADVVHVLNRGRIIASGTAAQLKARVGGRVAEIRLDDPAAAPAAARALARRLSLPPGQIRTETGAGRLTLAAHDGMDPLATLLAAAAALAADGITVDDLGLRQPSLDEAFLELTGVAAGQPGDGA
jgi:daunorubicin resistance ABC transporter ATP-binding subunit